LKQAVKGRAQRNSIVTTLAHSAMTICRWSLSFALGVMLTNGQSVAHQDMLADAVPNRTIDDQVLLLQTNFQFQQTGTRFTVNYDKSKQAFKDAKGTGSNWPSSAILKKYVEMAGISTDTEFSFFVANMMQESGLLTTTTENSEHYGDADYDWAGDKDGSNCPTTCAESDNVDAETSCCGSDCKSKCNNHYIGRGYLQTTWLKNYQLAKDGGCTKDESGNSVDIVKNPEKVASDTALAWCTSAIFWKREVHDDRCKGTTASKTTCDLGNTISAINGDQECEYGANFTEAHRESAQNRFCYFAAFYDSYSNKWPEDDTTCISDLSKKRSDNTHNGRSCESW